VDIFDHVTSLARASRSRVSKKWRGHFISVARRLPARGGSTFIATASSATLLMNSAYKPVYEQNLGQLYSKHVV